MRCIPKTLALAAAALAVAAAPAHAQSTISINVGASPSLANVLVDLIGTFQAYNFDAGLSYNIAVTVDTSANLKAAATAETPTYDLILTDDAVLAIDLAKNYSAFLEGLPRPFALDALDVYSTTTDISKGLPSKFTGPIAIAAATDPYGKDAAALLAGSPWKIKTLPSSRVTVVDNASAVQAGVELGQFAYGVVPKSAICTKPNGSEVYPEGSTHWEFPLAYGPLITRVPLTAVKLANTARTTDQATELAAFTDFLSGVGTTQGTDTLKRYCYCPITLK